MSDFRATVFYSPEDGGFIAEIPELKGCSAFGITAEEALTELEIAKAAWLSVAQEERDHAVLAIRESQQRRAESAVSNEPLNVLACRSFSFPGLREPTMHDLPLGWRVAGVNAAIKSDPEALDLTLIVSDGPAAAVGMFTTNRVCAAPVQVSRSRLPSRSIRGVVVNSGNANACTGEQGIRDAESMCRLAAEWIGGDSNKFLVCSTGVIGRPLRLDAVPDAISRAVKKLGRSKSDIEEAARAILTTDTRIKTSVRSVSDAKVFGFAKGAAMIGPNMATMLAFVVTDAVAEPETLAPILSASVDASFHSISVEGHTSTNDTVLLLANGASGVSPSREELQNAVAAVCMDLAQAIIRDSEGATKFVTIDVTGAPNDAAARTIAKAVADSALVKSALFGNDPNWGRICSAAGYAGVPFEERDLSLVVNGSLLYDRGTPTPFDKAEESARLAAGRDVRLELRFTLGQGKCRFWTSDLSYDYVRLNAEYTT